MCSHGADMGVHGHVGVLMGAVWVHPGGAMGLGTSVQVGFWGWGQCMKPATVCRGWVWHLSLVCCGQAVTFCP